MMAYDVQRIDAEQDPEQVDGDRIAPADRQRVAGYQANGWEVFMVTSAPDPQICLRRPTDYEPPAPAYDAEEASPDEDDEAVAGEEDEEEG